MLHFMPGEMMRLDVDWDASWGCHLEQLYVASAYGLNSSECDGWNVREREEEVG